MLIEAFYNGHIFFFRSPLQMIIYKYEYKEVYEKESFRNFLFSLVTNWQSEV